MKRIENNELIAIVGGFSITGTIINALTSANRFIYDVGKNLGSSLRRISGNNLCPLR